MTTAVAPVSAASSAAPVPLSRRRRIAVWSIVVLASVIALVGTLTVWVERQMLDDTAWRNASTKVIKDREVQAALSTYVVNQLYENVDVSAALQQRLPSNLKQLADPLAAALRQPATNTVKFLLGRPRIQQLFITTSGVAHDKLVNVLENKTGHGIETGNGVVTLNLHELVTQLGTEIGLSEQALSRIPADAGVITIMRSDQLASAQKGVRLIRILSAWALIAVLVLYALAIYLARGARRTVLRNVGWSLVIVGVILLVARHFIGNYVLDQLASPTYTPSARHVWLIETEILGQIGGSLILYGAIAVLGAVLAGATRPAVAARGYIAPWLNERIWLVAGIVAVAYLALVLWGPTHALRQWWGILLFAALIALGVYLLRTQTLAEAEAGVPAATSATTAAEIARLAELHDSGALSDEEFARAKTLALSQS
jgi:hypothetical protein